MGQPMSKLALGLMSASAFGLMVLLAVAGRGQVSAKTSNSSADYSAEASVSSGTEDRVAQTAFDGCDLPGVIVDTTGGPSGNPISRLVAERESAGIGATGAAAIATLGSVTIGTNLGTPGARIKLDLAGRPIDHRSAWVLVFRNQHIQLPGGAIPARPGSTRINPAHFAAGVITIVDSETGRLIYGWNC